jgi:hypothetical protein
MIKGGNEVKPTAQDRMEFIRLLGLFYTWLYPWAKAKGYRVSLGDSYREPKLSWENLGKVLKDLAKNFCYFHDWSYHCERCAQDINLIKPDGTLCENVEDYREMGEHWTGLDPVCVWGGNFSAHSQNPADADHFSYKEGK